MKTCMAVWVMAAAAAVVLLVACASGDTGSGQPTTVAPYQAPLTMQCTTVPNAPAYPR